MLTSVLVQQEMNFLMILQMNKTAIEHLLMKACSGLTNIS